MKIIYRTSDSGYSKVKATYINTEDCLKNASSIFKKSDWLVIADNVSKYNRDIILKYQDNILDVRIGNGAGTFNLALDHALTLDDNEVVYFLENDYVHRKDSDIVLEEGFSIGSEFVTLYDHLDKYFDGPNPYVSQGGEETKVFLSKSCHWKFTNSTTMTFAARVSTLKKYETTLRKWTTTTHPYDFDMWIDLRGHGATLISPIPGYSTHGDLLTIAPLINWEKEIQ